MIGQSVWRLSANGRELTIERTRSARGGDRSYNKSAFELGENMTKRTNNPAPHRREKEDPAGREPGTRPDGEAMPPKAIDPAPDGKGDAIPPLPEPDVEGVGKEDRTSAP